MDAWILTKLENFWMKIDISPYEVSRFFIVGSIFSMIVGTAFIFYKNDNFSISIFAIGFMCRWIFGIAQTISKTWFKTKIYKKFDTNNQS
jgi:1,4-dihydroxy-2-naphthoate octaprenyltransferase